MPVGHRGADNADLPGGRTGQREGGHIASVAPSVQPYARAVDVRQRLEVSHTVFQIAQFQLAQVLVDRPRRFDAFAAGRTVVAYPDDVTLLRQQLLPHRVASPGVTNLRRVRTAVGVLEYRIFLPGVEIGRFDHDGFHYEPVSRFDLQEFGLAQSVLRKRGDLVFVNHADLPAVGRMETNLRGRRRVAPRVDEMAESRIEVGAVRARRFGQALQPATIQFDSIGVAADVASLSPGKIDPAVGFINAVQSSRFPFPRS